MRRYGNLILSVVLVLSTLSGTWLLVSPGLEKQDELNRQNQLIENIEADTVVPTPTVEPVVLTETTVVPESIIIEPIPEPTTEPEPTPDPTPVPIGTELGIITIDKIDLKLPVTEGVEKVQLKISVGHVPETQAIGYLGNAVIAGHRNYTYGSMFNRLGEMEIGDIIAYAPIDGELIQFKVFEIAVIEPGDQIAFIQPKDESIITLYTCTPIREATHRLLVRAVKI